MVFALDMTEIAEIGGIVVTLSSSNAITGRYKKDSTLVWALGRVGRKFQAVFFLKPLFINVLHVIVESWVDS